MKRRGKLHTPKHILLVWKRSNSAGGPESLHDSIITNFYVSSDNMSDNKDKVTLLFTLKCSNIIFKQQKSSST